LYVISEDLARRVLFRKLEFLLESVSLLGAEGLYWYQGSYQETMLDFKKLNFI